MQIDNLYGEKHSQEEEWSEHMNELYVQHMLYINLCIVSSSSNLLLKCNIQEPENEIFSKNLGNIVKM